MIAMLVFALGITAPPPFDRELAGAGRQFAQATSDCPVYSTPALHQIAQAAEPPPRGPRPRPRPVPLPCAVRA